MWKTTGYGMIIYLATFTGISTEIYEAAYIDAPARPAHPPSHAACSPPHRLHVILFDLGASAGQFACFKTSSATTAFCIPRRTSSTPSCSVASWGSSTSPEAAVGFYLFPLRHVRGADRQYRSCGASNPENSLC
jgi:hypothetical protein